MPTEPNMTNEEYRAHLFDKLDEAERNIEGMRNPTLLDVCRYLMRRMRRLEEMHAREVLKYHDQPKDRP